MTTARAALGWPIERLDGSAQALHDSSALLVSGGGGRERLARALNERGRSLVLGSTQSLQSIDLAACAAGGVSVARRRSGGGAVLVERGDLVWVDLFLPAGDPLWQDDVGRAAWWVGEAWAAALAASGFPGATVWKGPMQRGTWSTLACFAGVGPGEVLWANGAKVVGISQRRTRWGALFQCACLLVWRPAELARLLALAPGDRERAVTDMESVAAGVGPAEGATVLDNFLRSLP